MSGLGECIEAESGLVVAKGLGRGKGEGLPHGHGFPFGVVKKF